MTHVSLPQLGGYQMLRKSIALFAVFSSFSGVAYAGDKPLYATAPAWVKPAPPIDVAKLTDGDPALVLLDQQQRLSDGQVWRYVDQAFRVASTQAMSELGQVTLPWQPDAGDLIVHRAQILRGAEVIDLLATGLRFQVLQREQQLEQRQLSGTLTATMAVEGLRVGDVVRVAYSATRTEKGFPEHMQGSIALLAAPVRAGFARARMSWPSGTPIQWRSYFEGTAPKVVRSDGFDTIDIALPLAKQPEIPADAPTRYRKLSLLEATTFADWPSVSKAMAPLYNPKGLIPPGSALAGEVAKITAKSSDPRMRTALALRLVQDEIRYLFRGMDGGNYIPQKPTDTWSLRYGDCKAKTLLLLAILDAMGIEAEAVGAHSTMGDSLPQRLPGVGALDHVLVRAVVGGKTLWLDGTGGGSWIEDLEDVPGLRHVLPLRAAGAELMGLARRAPARALFEPDIEIDQTAGLGLPTPYRVTMKARGELARSLHAASIEGSKEQLTGLVVKMVEPLLGDTATSSRSITYDAERAIATVRVSGIRTNIWSRSDGRYRMLLEKSENFTFAPDRARPAWKDIAVFVGEPQVYVVRLNVRLPDNGAGYTLEGNETLPRLAGTEITRSVRLADGWVRLSDRFEIPGDDIAASDIATERAKVALARTRLLTIVAPEEYPVRWRLVARHRKTGGLEPLRAAYAAAIADDPEEQTGYLNRANFNAGVWDWKRALPDFTRAIALGPSADVYLLRGAAREALGDDSGALQDAEAALLLDPSSMTAAGRIATFKARNGKLDEGMAMLAERAATAGGEERQGYVALQAELLSDAGRAQEAVALLDTLIVKTPGNPSLLNSRCWTKGIGNIALDTALKDCTKALELSENAARILDSRALIYFRMGRMDEALADLDAALELAPGEAASLYLRSLVRTRAGKPGAADDLTGARMMYPRIDEQYSRHGIKP